MKLKMWQLEYDFDKEDAKIVVPLILTAIGLSFTPLRKDLLLVGALVYYLLYFFLPLCFLHLREVCAHAWHWVRFRCPYCRSSAVFLQGYQGYHSDEQYPFYLCNRCGWTSVEVRPGKLVKALRGPSNPTLPK